MNNTPKDNTLCWIDGKITPGEKACLPVTDHGLLYGDGIFEGIRFYNRHPFQLEPHLKRFRDSAKAIALTCSWTDHTLTEIIMELIHAFSHPDGYIRMILTRGSGPLGINPTQCQSPRLILLISQLDMVPEHACHQGMRLITAQTRRMPSDSLDPRIKSLNYLNSILARIEAHAASADDAILLNQRGYVAEGSAANIFIAQDGLLKTPPATDGALEGITRALILKLARQQGIQAETRSLTPYDLYTADECFLTGTGIEIVPIRTIDGRDLPNCPGPVFKKCSHAFKKSIQNQCGGTSHAL